MVKLMYSPFGKPLSELVTTDLALLKDVSEGWYVEYKSQIISPKALAKSLSAFANQYGGWLFLGVSEATDATRCAGGFSGLIDGEIPALERALREAAKDGV